MNERYLIYGNGKVALFTNQTAAMEEAEYVLQNNPEVNEVAVYQLVKVGKRRTAVDWSGESEPKMEPPSNGVDHHYLEWSTEENSYLTQARKAGFTYEEIAKDLGRTKRAVEVQASRLRQSF
jgi:DNA-binding NarL/FixJ family response regulator